MASVGISQTARIKDYKIFRDHECLFAGSPENFFMNAYQHLGINYPKFYKMDNLSKAVFLACECLLLNRAADTMSDFKKGIILQNHSSSLDTDEKYQETLKTIPSPSLFVYTLPNICMGELAIRNRFKGENTFFITEKFDPEQLVQYVPILFKENILELAVIGYAEVMNGNLDIFLCLLEKEGGTSFSKETLDEMYTTV